MALFYFILKGRRAPLPDRDGVELPDEAAARAYAIVVAHELMRNCEYRTRMWRIQVRDADLQPLFEFSFASIDETIRHLSSAMRELIETLCSKAGALHDAIDNVQVTLNDVRQTIAEADRMTRLVGYRPQG